MIDWKEFLENKLLSFTGLEDKREYLHIEDLRKYFLSEVARITKIRKLVFEDDNLDSEEKEVKCAFLNGQLNYIRMLIGVDKK